MRRNLKQNHRRGFTLAETLLAVAILTVLLSVAAVGVIRYQRSLEQMEMDGIAKEIFVAAQNHLTLAESQGLVSGMDPSKWGDRVDDDLYCFVGTGENAETRENKQNALSILLPFGAVDESLLGAGSYVIFYQPTAGRVVDVFYAEPEGRFGHTFLTGETYVSLLACKGSENRETRRSYLEERSVIGWYGGEGGIPSGAQLKKPVLTVENSEQLIVKISNPNSGIALAGLKLIIEGEVSGVRREIHLIGSNGDLNPEYAVTLSDKSELSVVLDDVTGNKKHFAEWTAAGQPLDGLFPGENITIKAMAYNNNERTNIQYSNARTTNSLFGDTAAQGTDAFGAPSWKNTGVTVKAFRHLENLDPAISNLDTFNLTVTAAEQKADLDWETFTGLFGPDVSIEALAPGKSNSQPGTFLPVDLSGVDYAGKNTVSNIRNLAVRTVKDNEPAGVFGAVTGGSVSGLKLIDFDVASARDAAGALAGSTTNTEISNILVYNEKKDTAVSISGSSSAGGLVGTMRGGSIEQCAAAVYVTSADGDAGGLAGSVAGPAAVVKSYAGGHTENGKYKSETDGSARYNVQGRTSAGGLIGSCAEVSISDSYATTSVYGTSDGAVCGGFAGISSGGSVKGCYATGLVGGTADAKRNLGAFFGSSTGDSSAGNTYFSFVNEGLYAVGGTAEDSDGVTPFDQSVAAYNKIAKNNSGAAPYDKTILKGNYNGRYAFSAISDLTGSTDPAHDWLNRHYGDWPSMETMTVNTPG